MARKDKLLQEIQACKDEIQSLKTQNSALKSQLEAISSQNVSSAMEDLDATNVIFTEKEEKSAAAVEKYPSFVLFTILNGLLLVLTVLAGSAFIIVGNFLTVFGSTEVWGETNHFYLDIEIITVCIFGFGEFTSLR